MKWETCRNTKEGRSKPKRAMLRWKLLETHEKQVSLPPTPDPSPQSSPAIISWDSDADTVMSAEDSVPSRPRSIIAPRPGYTRPLLTDVLANNASPPYTLSAFTAFLSQNHCLETLEFVLEARKYQQRYDKVAAQLAGFPMNFDSAEVRELEYHWRKIIDVYLSPGSLREINLPSEERDQLLHVPYTVRPPPPELLEPAVKRMYDLMQESLWMPFLHQYQSQSSIPVIQTNGPISPDPSEGLWDLSRASTERSERRKSPHPSLHKKHSPLLGSDTHLSRSPPTGGHRPLSSALTSALHKSSAGTGRLSQQVSHTSVGSSGRECALTDDSGSLSPGLSEIDPMTPPTTPPSSDIGLGIHQGGHSPKSRSDSGAWKRLVSGWTRKRGGGPGARDDRLHPPYEED